MNIFDIIGPVMIGPSSSHTAGAVRLGRVANKLIDGRPLRGVEITLSGSFARTYRGHGTDRALLAGIMGYQSYSPEIRDALRIAEERGIEYAFRKEDIPHAHPNTARIRYFLQDGGEMLCIGAFYAYIRRYVLTVADNSVYCYGIHEPATEIFVVAAVGNAVSVVGTFLVTFYLYAEYVFHLLTMPVERAFVVPLAVTYLIIILKGFR